MGDGLLLVGDAAGLAYPQSGEGIRPAVESGLMAAETLLALDGRYDEERLEPYAAWLATRFGRAVRSRPLHDRLPAGVLGAAAGWLLASPWFTRNFLIERAFLQTQQPPLDAPPSAPGAAPA